MAGKGRQMNNTKVDAWFDNLVRQVPNCEEDERLMEVKVEINA
jgi:hypothetical protein